MFTYNINTTVTDKNGAQLLSGQAQVSADGRLEVEATLDANSVANYPVAFDSPKATVKALIVLSSHDIVVKVNSSSEPDNTVTFAGGTPFIWTLQNAGSLSPLHEKSAGDVDVATLYITRGVGVPASQVVTVSLRALFDPTP
jgi:hypothetical protein